jgi:chromosome segregation ATPase
MLGSFFRKPKSGSQTGLDLPPVNKEERTEIAHLKTGQKDAGEIVIPPRKKPLLSAENIALISILLLFIAGALGIWSYSRYHEIKAIRETELVQHEVVLDSLEDVKLGLEEHLDELEEAFTDLRSDNDTLATRLATTTNIVAQKEALIREIKAKNTRDEKALREQVQQLQTVVDRYETIIRVLDQKNAALTAENARLRGVTDSLSEEISELGLRMEAQIRKTMSAQYKATGFRVELERRNDKPTTRARRTRELKIYFDLNQVPRNFQGNQKLYLVITDDLGRPVASERPIDVSIPTERGPVAIVAQASQLQNVIDNQRVEMIYRLEERLKKGTYVAAVYSDKGPLGAASFRLN